MLAAALMPCPRPARPSSLRARVSAEAGLRPRVPADRSPPLPPASPPARAEDLSTLLSVLEATGSAHIASHILHLMVHCLSRTDPPAMSSEEMQRERRLAGAPAALPACRPACLPDGMAAAARMRPDPAPRALAPSPCLPAHGAECAQRLVEEIAAHKHHLQDAAQVRCCACACALCTQRVCAARRAVVSLPLAARSRPLTALLCRALPPARLQYTLGSLAAVVLGDERVSPAQREGHVSRLLEELQKATTPGQCQGARSSAPPPLTAPPLRACRWGRLLPRSPAPRLPRFNACLACSFAPLPPPIPLRSRAHRAELHGRQRAAAVRHGPLPRAPPPHRVWAAQP